MYKSAIVVKPGLQYAHLRFLSGFTYQNAFHSLIIETL